MKTLLELAAHMATETRDLVTSEAAKLRAEFRESLDQVKAVPGEKGDKGDRGDTGPAGADAAVDVEAIARAAAALVPAPKNGDPGKDAIVDHMQVVRDVLALIPAPKDGRDGIASRDELFALAREMLAEMLPAAVEARVAEVLAQMPDVRYRDVWTASNDYRIGNMVTFGGSVWHCNATGTTAKPGDGSADWTLAVKKGRDATVKAGT